MLVLSWQLTVLSLAITPLFVYYTYRAGKVRRQITMQAQESKAEISAITEETLSVSGMLLAKVFGRGPEEVDALPQGESPARQPRNPAGDDRPGALRGHRRVLQQRAGARVSHRRLRARRQPRAMPRRRSRRAPSSRSPPCRAASSSPSAACSRCPSRSRQAWRCSSASSTTSRCRTTSSTARTHARSTASDIKGDVRLENVYFRYDRGSFGPMTEPVQRPVATIPDPERPRRGGRRPRPQRDPSRLGARGRELRGQARPARSHRRARAAPARRPSRT